MRRWLVPLLALCLLCPSLGRATPTAPPRLDFHVERFRLANGLDVVLHRDPRFSSVMVHVWYRVGSKDEKRGRSGFAHLFEHLMFKGSKHVPDGRFDTLLEAAGAWNNGTTNADRTNYFEQLPANQLELALYLEADRMAGLWETMSQDKLDNQRDVVKNERRQSYENRPYGKAELELQQALWPEGHGNHNLTIGTMADLSAASLADVEAFYRSYYVPNNATLVLAGKLETATARALCDRYFGWIPRRPDPLHVTLTAPVTPLETEKRLTTEDSVQVPKLIYAWRAPATFGAGSAGLDLAAYLLGGSKSSRLYKRLVFNDRIASTVSAYYSEQSLGGEFVISAIAKKGVAPTKLERAIDEELQALLKVEPTAAELVRARNALMSRFLRSLESLASRTAHLARYAAFANTPNYFNQDIARYYRETPASVHKAVRTWLQPEHRVRLLVTPQANKNGAKNAKK